MSPLFSVVCIAKCMEQKKNEFLIDDSLRKLVLLRAFVWFEEQTTSTLFCIIMETLASEQKLRLIGSYLLSTEEQPAIFQAGCFSRLGKKLFVLLERRQKQLLNSVQLLV